LLNGDRKNKLKATESGSNVAKYFRQANSLQRELWKAKFEGLLDWDENGDLSFDEDFRIDIRG
jgi:hypothetical protein